VRGSQQVVQAGEVRSARIESLRGLAALGVVFGHVFVASVGIGTGSLPNRLALGGGLGVFLFFTLTGYLLFWPFVKRNFGGGGPIDLARYARNRALRILPLYYVVLVVFMLLVEHGGSPSLWLHFVTFTQGFDERTVTAVDGPMWSLVVELQFYVLLPLLAFAIARVARRSKLGAAAIVAALGLVSAAVWWQQVHKVGGTDLRWRYSLLATFMNFTPGMLLALLRLRLEQRPLRRMPSSSALLMAAALVWLVAADRIQYAQPIAVVASFLTVAAVVLPVRGGRLVSILEVRALAFVGVASYSLYLWHQPIVESLERHTSLGFAPLLALALAVCLAVAFASYRLVERPFLALRRRWAPSPATGGTAQPSAATAGEQGAEQPAGPQGLRQIAARGTVVNAAFLVGMNSLGLLRSFLVAIFVAAGDFGIWGVLVMAVGALTMLKDGLGDKYVQQREDDQRTAFQKAFTIELMANGVLMVAMLVVLLVLAAASGHWQLVAPGLVFISTLPAIALRAPTWVFYREMRFAQQRTLEAIDPLVSLVATVGLAAAGLGYWALVLGYAAGVWAAAIAAVRASPYPLAIRFDRETARSYFHFTWPLLVANASVLLIPQLSAVVGQAALGLAGAGAITLAGAIASYADRVDAIITQTIYPAVCRVADRRDLLLEVFEKSNRLDLMWGIPFGAGIALFAPDLIHFAIGEKWRPALVLIQVLALTSAANHFGYNWTAFMRARGDTKAFAIVGPIVSATFLTVALPLLVVYGLPGFAAGMAVMTAVSLAVRGYFIRKMFPAYSQLQQALRAVAPTVPAVAVVLLARLAEPGPRTAAVAVAELVVYGLVTAAATLGLERGLIREMVGYLRGGRPRFARAEALTAG
jgi:peptidoglycan/LPS O-acetylase OafA/YrhL/O-antigen/teichoic acid export membrane protein